MSPKLHRLYYYWNNIDIDIFASSQKQFIESIEQLHEGSSQPSCNRTSRDGMYYIGLNQSGATKQLVRALHERASQKDVGHLLVNFVAKQHEDNTNM